LDAPGLEKVAGTVNLRAFFHLTRSGFVPFRI